MSVARPGDGKSQDVPITWVAYDRELLKAAGAACWRSIDGKLFGFAFGCPCGCGYHYIPVTRGAPRQAEHVWGWDGDEAKPTLAPSICNTGCQWHGYLKGGVFTPTPARRG